MGFPRQEYWSLPGLPFPPPGNLPDQGFQLSSPVSPAFQEDSFTSEPPGKPNVGVQDIPISYLFSQSNTEEAVKMAE